MTPLPFGFRDVESFCSTSGEGTPPEKDPALCLARSRIGSCAVPLTSASKHRLLVHIARAIDIETSNHRDSRAQRQQWSRFRLRTLTPCANYTPAKVIPSAFTLVICCPIASGPESLAISLTLNLSYERMSKSRELKVAMLKYKRSNKKKG